MKEKPFPAACVLLETHLEIHALTYRCILPPYDYAKPTSKSVQAGETRVELRMVLINIRFCGLSRFWNIFYHVPLCLLSSHPWLHLAFQFDTLEQFRIVFTKLVPATNHHIWLRSTLIHNLNCCL